MDKNGNSITQKELEYLPEAPQVVLWQTEEAPTTVIDIYGHAWNLGFYKGVLYKRKVL